MATFHIGISGRWPMLLLLTLLANICSGHEFDIRALLARSSDCPSSYVSCNNTKLPDNFCCPSDATCISLDSASSAICCPAGVDCDYISPITCDIQEQNVTRHADSTVKSTRLDDSLPKCDKDCCPFGYTCAGGTTCVLNKKTATTATASTTSSTSTATITPMTAPDTCSEYPAKAVAIGAGPGFAVGAILALIIACCVQRRAQGRQMRRQEKSGGRSSPSSAGTQLGISYPIPQNDTSYRSDFLRPQARDNARNSVHRMNDSFAPAPQTDPRFDNSAPHYSVANYNVPNHNIPDHNVDYNVPHYPVPSHQRELSTHSIKIYTPSNQHDGLRSRPETTFSEILDDEHPANRGHPHPHQNPFRDPVN